MVTVPYVKSPFNRETFLLLSQAALPSFLSLGPDLVSRPQRIYLQLLLHETLQLFESSFHFALSFSFPA